MSEVGLVVALGPGLARRASGHVGLVDVEARGRRGLDVDLVRVRVRVRVRFRVRVRVVLGA